MSKRFYTGLFLMLIGAGGSLAIIAKQLPSSLYGSFMCFLLVANGAILITPDKEEK